ncbi:DUF5821 family protein (plasmid) [Haloferax sp. S1W]|uniref:transcriptional regulator TbsP domain-containing protein n=1 Tax=Haloferax sp. S1W TaxID=3377110 RepID=UPI0037C79CE3
MGQTSRAGVYKDLLTDSLSEAVDEMIIATSQLTVIETLVEEIGSSDDVPNQIKLITTRDTLQKADSNFVVSSRLNQYFDEGILNIRTHPEDHPPAVFVTVNQITYVHPTSGGEGILMSTEDEEVVISVREQYITRWKNGGQFQLSNPSYARMLESIGQDLGGSMQESIQSVFESAGLSQRDGTQMDEVDVYLLMGALNEKQFYQVCSWGEDMGIASRAKFSNHKRALEDAGLVTTEKVATDVGRPRQRLLLAKETLKNASPQEVIQVAQSVV